MDELRTALNTLRGLGMANEESKLVHLRPKRTCPICGRPAVQKFHPFCSRRCADVDLNRWLKGQYAIPAEEQPPEEEDDKDGG